MGVGKSMKIFMEGMQNSMMSSGYTGKIVNTQMGPFSWNEETNSWVNQNNGFSIPNISLQDLMMYDFGTVTDETENSRFKSIQCVYAVQAVDNRSVNDITGMVTFGNVSLRSPTCPFNLSLKNISSPLNLIDNFKIYVSTDLGVTKSLFTFTGITTNSISVDISNVSMRIYIEPNSPATGGVVCQFQLINSSDGDAVIASLYQASLAAS